MMKQNACHVEKKTSNVPKSHVPCRISSDARAWRLVRSRPVKCRKNYLSSKQQVE